MTMTIRKILSSSSALAIVAATALSIMGGASIVTARKAAAVQSVGTVTDFSAQRRYTNNRRYSDPRAAYGSFVGSPAYLGNSYGSYGGYNGGFGYGYGDNSRNITSGN